MESRQPCMVERPILKLPAEYDADSFSVMGSARKRDILLWLCC